MNQPNLTKDEFCDAVYHLINELVASESTESLQTVYKIYDLVVKLKKESQIEGYTKTTL